MAKNAKRESRQQERRNDAAIKLVGLGGAFVFLPLFLGNSPLAKVFAGLFWPGAVLMIAGGVLLWLGKRRNPAPPVAAAPIRVDPQQERKEPSFAAGPAGSHPPSARASNPRGHESRPSTWSKEVFNAIEWRRFEAVVEKLFQQAGFETKSKSHGADEGVDVWLFSRNHGNSPVSLVQCKHWHGKQVGVDKIRELRGVMAAFNVKRGQYATTSTYSDAARAFAKENNINLLDVGALLALIARRTPEQQSALLEVALEGDYWCPTCVNCGVKMVERKPKNGGRAFWGCMNYPSCKTVMQMRDA